jgi:phosphoribosyl 1,2-cyclic phosphate phosphodiesterase
MEILFLGTAAAEGIPALFCRCEYCREAALRGGRDLRLRCSFLVNRHLLLDFSPDVMTHKRLYNLDLAAVDTVCITHSHTDHLNVPDLGYRDTQYFAHIPDEKPLQLYGNKKSCAVIRQGLEFEFGILKDDCLEIHEIAPGSIVQSAKLRITALAARHDPREDCMFFLVQEEKTAFLQMNDTALPGEDLERSLAGLLQGKKLNAVSMDCTNGREPGGKTHMSIEDIVVLKKRLVNAGLADEKTIFAANHFSHNGHILHAELEQTLAPHNIIPAWDGMVLALAG